MKKYINIWIGLLLIVIVFIGYRSVVINNENRQAYLSEKQTFKESMSEQLNDNMEKSRDLISQCIADAESNYNGTWDTLCERDGKRDMCTDFVGSPKDEEYIRILQTDKQNCIAQYK